jgi:two-component system, sensor histidine kinase and response regulator
MGVSSSQDLQPTQAKVLVVDDNRELLQILTEVLETHGFHVIAANHADEALSHLAKDRPDIIISDIMMPGTDGFRFNSQVRSNPEWSDIPFVFLTALSDDHSVRAGKAHGCDDYITKPFNPLDLKAVIDGKLNVFRTRQRNANDRFEKFRRRIVHTLSHEFRTPLVAINTGTELLMDQRDNLNDEQLDRLLGSIQRGGARLQRLVEDFMTLQQIDSGIAESTAGRLRTRISLVHVAETAIDCFQELQGENRGIVNFVAHPSENLHQPFVFVYDIQIVSAVHRLLSNSLKFAGTEKPVEVSVRTNADYASIFIRDYGPGMTEKALQEARGMFVQIDRERQEQQGCGLGLTIASYFVSINDGEMGIRTPTDGKGGLELELRFKRVL